MLSNLNQGFLVSVTTQIPKTCFFAFLVTPARWYGPKSLRRNPGCKIICIICKIEFFNFNFCLLFKYIQHTIWALISPFVIEWPKESNCELTFGRPQSPKTSFINL